MIFNFYLQIENIYYRATFTSTLSDGLLQKLASWPEKLSMPKKKLIENALGPYWEHLKRTEYIKSYKLAARDVDVILPAEAGMGEYLKQTEDETR